MDESTDLKVNQGGITMNLIMAAVRRVAGLQIEAAPKGSDEHREDSFAKTVEGKKFRSSKTGRMVGFNSLPAKQRGQIREQYHSHYAAHGSDARKAKGAFTKWHGDAHAVGESGKSRMEHFHEEVKDFASNAKNLAPKHQAALKDAIEKSHSDLAGGKELFEAVKGKHRGGMKGDPATAEETKPASKKEKPTMVSEPAHEQSIAFDESAWKDDKRDGSRRLSTEHGTYIHHPVKGSGRLLKFQPKSGSASTRHEIGYAASHDDAGSLAKQHHESLNSKGSDVTPGKGLRSKKEGGVTTTKAKHGTYVHNDGGDSVKYVPKDKNGSYVHLPVNGENHEAVIQRHNHSFKS